MAHGGPGPAVDVDPLERRTRPDERMYVRYCAANAIIALDNDDDALNSVKPFFRYNNKDPKSFPPNQRYRVVFFLVGADEITTHRGPGESGQFIRVESRSSLCYEDAIELDKEVVKQLRLGLLIGEDEENRQRESRLTSIGSVLDGFIQDDPTVFATQAVTDEATIFQAFTETFRVIRTVRITA